MGNSAAVAAANSSHQQSHGSPATRQNVSIEILANRIDAELELVDPASQLVNHNALQKREVQLRLMFTKIGDIDTVRECLDASLYLEARWREPLLDDVFTTVDTAGMWQPDLYIYNSIGDFKHRKEVEIVRLDSGATFVQEQHSIRGKFYEQMELWHFPFDTQDLTATVCSNLPNWVIDLQVMPDRPCRVLTSTFTDVQEWRLHTHVETTNTSIISDSHIGPRKRPALNFTTRATRRSMFYMVNIWFVSFILCALAMCVFAIDRLNLQGRLQLSFILLLTTITFKFVVTNSIPRISYLTILDKAVLFNLIFLVLLSVWHSITSPHDLYGNEKYAIIGFAVLYFIGMLALGITILCGAWRRRREMDEKDRLHEIRIANLSSTKDALMKKPEVDFQLQDDC